ncbi:MAG: LysR family transcriptional regulator [Lachnospiraceae bacterium]|nr:LysR family transcriptional regulator [Lachnospiraceae bacterium]
MDIYRLEYALAVADLKSLNKAAFKLHLSPSALSQHITKLEQEYNVSLFERTREAWYLTEAGKVVMASFKEILQIQQDTLLKIDRLKLNALGSLKLGLLSEWTVPLFSALFPEFQKRYPDITVHPHREEAVTLMNQIAIGQVDFAFLVGFGPNPWSKQKFGKEYVGEEQLILVLPKKKIPEKYAGGDLREADLRDFKEERFYLTRSNTAFRRLEDEMFYLAGFDPKIASESIDIPSMNELSLSGFGPSFILSNRIRPSEQTAFFRPVPGPTRPIYAVYRENHVLSPAESFLISLAKEYYALDPLDRTATFLNFSR